MITFSALSCGTEPHASPDCFAYWPCVPVVAYPQGVAASYARLLQEDAVAAYLQHPAAFDQVAFDQVAFDQVAFDLAASGQAAFEYVAFDQVASGPVASGPVAFGPVAFDQAAFGPEVCLHTARWRTFVAVA